MRILFIDFHHFVQQWSLCSLSLNAYTYSNLSFSLSCTDISLHLRRYQRIDFHFGHAASPFSRLAQIHWIDYLLIHGPTEK